MYRITAAFLVLPFMGGCFYSDLGTAGESRPDFCPAVQLFVISGHTMNDADCDSEPEYNCEYLEGRGTGWELEQVFVDQGLETRTWYFTDNLYSWGLDANGDDQVQVDEVFAFGFLDLMARIEGVAGDCVGNFSNPTRLVVAAHSHGTVWAHTAVMLLDSIQFDYLVDLDGNALCWESDLQCLLIGDNWYSALNTYYEDEQPNWRFNPANASDSWGVEGRSELFDIEDVAPPNVEYNIETRANDLPAYDNAENYRLDGTRAGVFTAWFDATHRSVTVPGAEPLDWTLAQMGELEELRE